MHTRSFIRITVLLYFLLSIQLFAEKPKISALYGGGPIYDDASRTITELKNSGFNTIIVWTIHVNNRGDLNFNMNFPIASGGQYTGASTHSDFASNMDLLKEAPTSVTRIEFGISAWGSLTFEHIKNLIDAEGTGPNSILYRNFKALKDAVPAVDAINFDDEKVYDVASSVKFAVMLHSLGYKVALCPYTQALYWKDVASQSNAESPGCVDFIYLQCYSGGSGNTPGSWSFGNLPVYPGLWDKDYTPEGMEGKMTEWKNQFGVTGGFVWLYDDFDGTDLTKQYAAALNNAFEIGAPGQAANPTPENNATGVSNTVTIQWEGGSDAQSHDLYFGTSNPPPKVMNCTENSYKPSDLLPNTKYYWRIDELNFYGKTTGTVWNFTTSTSAVLNEILHKKDVGIITVTPNKFRNCMSITFYAPNSSALSASIINCKGQEIIHLSPASIASDRMTFTWNGTNMYGENVSPGIYIIRIKTTDPHKVGAVYNKKVLYQ